MFAGEADVVVFVPQACTVKALEGIRVGDEESTAASMSGCRPGEWW